eukprot:6140598-Amphidinium_carterae.1
MMQIMNIKLPTPTQLDGKIHSSTSEQERLRLTSRSTMCTSRTTWTTAQDQSRQSTLLTFRTTTQQRISIDYARDFLQYQQKMQTTTTSITR